MFGSNIVVSAPNAHHVSARLESLDLLVVADIMLSETAARADVVLPVTQFAEETGTMTNLEGRVVLRQRRSGLPDGVRSDLDVLSGLAERLGSPVPFATDPEEVFAELGRPRPVVAPTTRASPTTGSARSRACSGPARPPTTPAPRGCSSTPSPPRTGGRASTPSSTAARPSSRARSTPCT